MGLTAVAINNELWSKTLEKVSFGYYKIINKLIFGTIQELIMGTYNIILAGPEECIKDTAFHQIQILQEFSQKIMCFVIDKVHYVSQWGGDFHPTYAELDQL